MDPLNKFLSLHGSGDTIGIGREIQCLPYAGFFFKCQKLVKLKATISYGLQRSGELWPWFFMLFGKKIGFHNIFAHLTQFQ